MFGKMIAVLVLLGALVPLVGGYSTGAGSCAGGGAPVSGKHLSRVQITSGTLEAYDINVTLGDSGPMKTGVPLEFEYGRPHFLTLSCSSNAPYLGFLVRLSSPDGIDTTAALTPFSNDKDTQVADSCINIEGVGGLTHTNNAPKSNSQSILEMDEAAQGMILDVTVVVANAGFYSEFYYSQYILNAVAPAGSPPAAPAPSPSASQVTMPTTADLSVTVPTTADVVYPPRPKKEESVPPAKKADGAPVASLDSVSPLAVPVAAPAASPDAAPVALPFSAPATAPAAAPATAPDSPTATVSGVQGTDASSGASNHLGTAYATLSLLVFTSFCFAF
jgi:hypothetical protein